ncbi:MAG: glycoside hydrolase family 130 protein [Actinomycetota bacterium]|nr:glycoside hydrolase family 130 protein [Actinomycetota bacterium]
MDWMLGPFVKQDGANPILGACFDARFACPVRGRPVRWRARAIIGAAAVVKDDQLWVVYHAEDTESGYAGLRGSPGTMRLGLAASADGLDYQCREEPVLYPAEDFMKEAEWPGGCEIPRLVEGPERTYYLYYSAWNKTVTRLAVATSTDLVHWEKRGLAFGKAADGRWHNLWSKAGAVVTTLENGRLVAARLNGLYWMYWGESEIFVATSPDLIDWSPVTWPKDTGRPARESPAQVDPARNQAARDLYVTQEPRTGMFDSGLVEGGVAVLTENGIVHIYNAGDDNSSEADAWKTSDVYYSLGQALYDANDPVRLLQRSDSAFLRPDREYEILGAIPNVVYCTGIAYFRDKWWLFYNGADWVVNVATSVAPRQAQRHFQPPKAT